MQAETSSLQGMTSAKYVGPFMVAILCLGVPLAVRLALEGKFNEAIFALLVAICFMLVGLAALLGALIVHARQRTQAETAERVG